MRGRTYTRARGRRCRGDRTAQNATRLPAVRRPAGRVGRPDGPRALGQWSENEADETERCSVVVGGRTCRRVIQRTIENALPTFDPRGADAVFCSNPSRRARLARNAYHQVLSLRFHGEQFDNQSTVLPTARALNMYAPGMVDPRHASPTFGRQKLKYMYWYYIFVFDDKSLHRNVSTLFYYR